MSPTRGDIQRACNILQLEAIFRRGEEESWDGDAVIALRQWARGGDVPKVSVEYDVESGWRVTLENPYGSEIGRGHGEELWEAVIRAVLDWQNGETGGGS